MLNSEDARKAAAKLKRKEKKAKTFADAITKGLGELSTMISHDPRAMKKLREIESAWLMFGNEYTKQAFEVRLKMIQTLILTAKTIEGMYKVAGKASASSAANLGLFNTYAANLRKAESEFVKCLIEDIDPA